MKNKFLFISIFIAIGIVIIIVFRQPSKVAVDKEVFKDFDYQTRLMETSITSLNRYNSGDTYYYNFKFNYEFNEERGVSEIIYVYHFQTKSIKFFNINDIEFYPNDYDDYLKTIDNGSKKSYTTKEYHQIIGKLKNLMVIWL